MSLPDLLHSLTIAGLRLELAGDNLKVIGDTSLLTTEHKAALTANKGTLVAMLSLPKANEDPLFNEPIAYFETKAEHQRLLAAGEIGCPWCGQTDTLYDAEAGLGCSQCKTYAWFDSRSGGLFRADTEVPTTQKAGPSEAG